MKNLLFLFCFVSFNSIAQLSVNRFNINAKFSMGKIDEAAYICPGLFAEWFIHDKIGLNYNFDLLRRNDYFNQTRTPMGLIGGPILIAAGLANSLDGDTTNSSGAGLFGFLLLALPDGVSIHQALGYRGDLSPYANVLGIDFIKNRLTGDRRIKYSCTFGIKGSFIVRDHLVLSAFVEGRKTASIPIGFGGGLSVGYAFNKRN